jgi:uracil-DNA glycosylase
MLIAIITLMSMLLMIYPASSLQIWSCLVATKAFPRSYVRAGPAVPKPFSTMRSNIVMMPEGPEVKILIDQLQPAVGMRLVNFKFLSGRYVTHGRPTGFEDFAKTMTPRSGNSANETNDADTNVDVITKLSCKGKFIYIVLDHEKEKIRQDIDIDNDYQRSIWITLGMTGQFVNEKEVKKPKPLASNSEKASTLRWYFELMDTSTKVSRKIYYRDARNFGTLRFCVSAAELNEKLASLGPDLLDFENTTEEVFLAAIEKSTQNRNICKFLMDQSKIAGIGNYILSEGLYRSRLDPFADLVELSITQRRRLFRELREVASTSYQAQGLTRSNGGTYRDIAGGRGQFEFQLQCYGQRLSPNKFPVTQEMNGPHGRTIWYVEEEQLFMPRSTRSMLDNVKESATIEGANTEATYISSKVTDQLTEKGWKNALFEYMASQSFQSLLSRIQTDANRGATIYPPVRDVFSALNLCSLEDVKVVIVGQDPYHGPGQGNGLAFSVRKGIKPPPSLLNIFKEAIDDVGIDPPKHGTLEKWAKQGVLLLNTVLTVRKGEANSHAKMGWEEFTDEVIRTINDKNDSVVFLLWGGPAAKKAKCVDESKHTVIRTSHVSYTKETTL